MIIFFFLFCFYIEKQKVVEIRQRKEWPTAKLLGLFRFTETMDRGAPLKEAARCRRNALLSQVKKAFPPAFERRDTPGRGAGRPNSKPSGMIDPYGIDLSLIHI